MYGLPADFNQLFPAEGGLASQSEEDVEVEDGVLVIKRIRVRYRL